MIKDCLLCPFAKINRTIPIWYHTDYNNPHKLKLKCHEYELNECKSRVTVCVCVCVSHCEQELTVVTDDHSQNLYSLFQFICMRIKNIIKQVNRNISASDIVQIKHSVKSHKQQKLQTMRIWLTILIQQQQLEYYPCQLYTLSCLMGELPACQRKTSNPLNSSFLPIRVLSIIFP